MTAGLDEGGVARTQRRLKVRLAFQRSRALAYALALAVGAAALASGALKARLADGLLVSGIGMASAALIAALHLRAQRRGGVDGLDAIWLGLDPVLISWGIVISGGFESPWYLWYLAAMGSAAFVAGRTATTAVAAWCAVCYLATLVLMGHVRGFDPSLAMAVTRMVFLEAAAFFFLGGVADLKEKRRVIQALKEAETRKVEELRRLAGALDESAHALADANAKIREADRLKTQFLANMSHELRTPLNSIIGFSEVLKTRLAGQVPPRQLKFLENINASGQHLLGIINDILDLSKIEAGKMEVHPESFSLRSLVDGVCHVMRGMAAKAGITFETSVPEDLPPLEADPVKVKQVLYNLLSNAVKFSPDGSVVTLSARLLPARESALGLESVEVAVTDRGIGIAREDQELIFQEFRQADGTATRRFAGTGLGLALVRKLVELHEGRIALESAPGRGSTFTVTLPRAFAGTAGPAQPLPSGATAAADASAPGPGGGHQRVLVVEDDPAAYDAIASALADASFIPLRARSGTEAVMLAQTLRPDAITLDLVLPELDGWEVLKALKLDPSTERIPVVIVSVVESRELGLALGADDYLQKPVDRERLVARLGELLRDKRRGETRILVIDDDPALHELLDAFLLPLGYETVHALSGEDGLARARAIAPTLIILDLMMDGMDGFEVASRLSASPETSAIPVLVLTARDLGPEDRVRLSGKIEALVTKGDPTVTRRRLTDLLSAIVGRRGREGARG